MSEQVRVQSVDAGRMCPSSEGLRDAALGESTVSTEPHGGPVREPVPTVVRVGPQNNAVVKIGDYWNG